ncbi:MAG: hypothetical protein G3M78_06185 [Candidatus Nitrohelix vancouverensis]|uniref:VOC domain-containing protein n=1 Tax=Candidatus Nitrohelix vancouverensis TaxID=2705534 RepID=A0A7T0C1U3_9BACT|nr:MAG: hypothetical protein G3M78_06185 [Candidatus Nitrohelix vancouverensis]
MQLQGIHHIALNVRDLDRSERFYTDVMGFKVTDRFSKGLRHLMLDAGNVSIALFESPELDARPPLETLSEKGYMHFAFQTTREQFDSIIEELQAKGVVIEDGPVKRGAGVSVYFNDPDFNHLEIRYDD